ncbi:MAG TPA: NADPH-dependent oxidoreductase [Planctomycetes bacterium]|nr:NADPH-dependent oxidoreductase [Planctomycetota bacterium]
MNLEDLPEEPEERCPAERREEEAAKVLERMWAHRSRRAFEEEDLPQKDLEDCVAAAQRASTSSFLQPYSVVVVRDPERKRRVYELCSQQQMILDAPVFLALCVDFHRAEKACRDQGKELAPIDLETLLIGCIDTSLFAQNLLLAAEAMGYGGCFVGAARNHPLELARVLGLPPKVFVLFGLVLGRPCDDPMPMPRLPLEAVLHREQYDLESVSAHLDAFDAQMRAFARRLNRELQARGAKKVNEDRGFRDRLAFRLSTEKRPSPRDRIESCLKNMGFLAEGEG